MMKKKHLRKEIESLESQLEEARSSRDTWLKRAKRYAEEADFRLASIKKLHVKIEVCSFFMGAALTVAIYFVPWAMIWESCYNFVVAA